MRKQLNRLNPTRQLPKPMRRYLGLPNRLFLIWLVLSGLLLGASLHRQSKSPPPAPATETQPESRFDFSPLSSAYAEGIVASVDVSGPQAFTLKGKGGKIFITPQGQPPLALVDDAGGPQVQTVAGDLVYRLKLDADGQMRIFDGAGALRQRMKCETEDNEETCKLYNGQATLLHRFKLKPDSFNVYGTGSERIYKGKPKNGKYVLKTDADAKVLEIGGVHSLKAAALLSLPVEVPIRALLWRQAGF